MIDSHKTDQKYFCFERKIRFLWNRVKLLGLKICCILIGFDLRLTHFLWFLFIVKNRLRKWFSNWMKFKVNSHLDLVIILKISHPFTIFFWVWVEWIEEFLVLFLRETKNWFFPSNFKRNEIYTNTGNAYERKSFFVNKKIYSQVFECIRRQDFEKFYEEWVLFIFILKVNGI